MFFFQCQSRLFAENDPNGYDYANGLGQRCTQSRTGRTEAHPTDEQLVQRDVGNTGNGDKVHGTLGVTHSPEDGADDVIGCNEGDANKADGKIENRTIHRFFGSGHYGDNGFYQRKKQRGNDNGQSHKQGNRIADGGRGILFFFERLRLC